MEENVCRLCLNFAKTKFEVIDAVTRQMLEVLLLKVELDISTNPILCLDCCEIIKKSYLFKSTCIDTEELILSFSAAKETNQIDIKDVYKDSKGMNNDDCGDFNICRFCIERIRGSNVVSLDVLLKEVTYMEMLPVYMPKIVLSNIKDPVICASCKENLERYFTFTKTCLDTEKKINEYIRREGTNITSQIKLSSVHSLLFNENAVAYSENSSHITKIKQENLLEDVEQNTDVEMYDRQIKYDALDIKEEEVSLEEVYKCNICAYESKHEDSLKKHMLNPHVLFTEEIYKCEECSYETKHKKYLSNHRQTTHKHSSRRKVHKCEVCTYESIYKNAVTNHMLTHKINSEVEMHKCGICTYETKLKNNITKHMLTHKDNSEVKMHKCEICTYVTKYKGGLNKHMLIHKDISEVELYKCAICSYVTKFKGRLQKHLIIHKDKSELELYKCEICAYESKYKGHLKAHMQKHTGIPQTLQMYKCEICSYEIKCRAQLNRHMLKHKDKSEVEMYKCDTCTFETKYKEGLKSHMLKHKDISEVEIYKCDICSYETRYKSYLKSHKLNLKH